MGEIKKKLNINKITAKNIFLVILVMIVMVVVSAVVKLLKNNTVAAGTGFAQAQSQCWTAPATPEPPPGGEGCGEGSGGCSTGCSNEACCE